MGNYSREALQEVLAKHGYKVHNMDSGWTTFALSLVQTELLEDILGAVDNNG